MGTTGLIILSAIMSVFMGGCERPSHRQGGQEGSLAIQIKGSDTMVNLGQTWAEAYVNKHPASMIAVTGGGSGTGIAALISGTAEIAETSRKMTEKEILLAKSKGYDPQEFIVALDALAVVVHPDNPVGKLTMDELAKIFTRALKNWKEVGGNDQPIVLLSREVNSGTHIYFKEHILKRKGARDTTEFSPTALLMPSSQAIADEIAQNINAIGYYGMGYVGEKQKALAIAQDKDSLYFKPTIENVRSENYPISRPLLMYTQNKPQGLVKEFLNFVLSDEGQQLVKEIEFVPIK
ncbi:MAG: phosphate ABC transporter substrate-binding protein [bacterium]